MLFSRAIGRRAPRLRPVLISLSDDRDPALDDAAGDYVENNSPDRQMMRGRWMVQSSREAESGLVWCDWRVSEDFCCRERATSRGGGQHAGPFTGPDRHSRHCQLLVDRWPRHDPSPCRARKHPCSRRGGTSCRANSEALPFLRRDCAATEAVLILGCCIVHCPIEPDFLLYYIILYTVIPITRLCAQNRCRPCR